MSQPSDNTHYVRRVVLPSGRAIEVVYFDNQAHTDEPAEVIAPRATSTRTDLELCPDCEQPLVYPVEWEEASSTQWEVHLRCPNCEWEHTGVYDQDTVDRFDEHLDRGTEALVRDLRRLTRANMEDEIDAFVRALEADAIQPMDF
jgi:hypothetical protein